MTGGSNGGAVAADPRLLHTVRLLLALGWLAAAGAGLFVLERHAATPAAEASVQGLWPPDSRLAPPRGRPLLLLFLHPECPCSRATLTELARLVARAGGSVDVVALLCAEGERLVSSVEAIPGVRVCADRDGEEARRFGAAASGHCLLYGGGGALLYSGGITGARGHEGDNAGADAIVAHLAGSGGAARGPVYGCPLVRSGMGEATDG